jgi:hypothetical protein
VSDILETEDGWRAYILTMPTVLRSQLALELRSNEAQAIVLVLAFVLSSCNPSPSAQAPATTARLLQPPSSQATGPYRAILQEGKTNVVVELYSSEGCSSCPPAEDVLRELDLQQSVPGANVLALEYHVDYWNHLGWRDPFSSEAFSTRQHGFNRAIGKNSIYTPQMVVDGEIEFVGSAKSKALASIESAAREPHLHLDLAASTTDARAVSIRFHSDAPIALFAVQTERGLSTAVSRGENAGRKLAHGPVVRSVTPIGSNLVGNIVQYASLPVQGQSLVVLAVAEGKWKIVGSAEFRAP